MLFFLRKLAEAVSLPLGLALALILLGVLLRRRWLAVVAALLLLASATDFGARLLNLPLERTYPEQRAEACPPADVIVALSGDIVHGLTAAGVQWGESAGRYLAALELARRHKADRLVFTGAPLGDGSGMTEGGVLRQAAIDQGIEPARIVVTGTVLTTDDEAHAVAHLAGVHSVILVTHAFHMPRAVMLFRARGLRVIPFPTAERFPGSTGEGLMAVLPTARGLRSSDEAMREYYGLAAYRLLLPLRRNTATGPQGVSSESLMRTAEP